MRGKQEEAKSLAADKEISMDAAVEAVPVYNEQHWRLLLVEKMFGLYYRLILSSV